MAKRYAQPHLRTYLEGLLGTYGPNDIESDPIRWVHQFEDEADRELVGLIASTLAYGIVAAIQTNVGNAIDRLDGAPAKTLQGSSPSELHDRFRGFRHRFHDGTDLALLLNAFRQVREEYGSFGRAITVHYENAGGDIREGLACGIDALRDADHGGIANIKRRASHAGIWHSLANPRRGSACKRWNLYLRWMVRRQDGVDFGLWNEIDPADLIIPLDTHVARVSRYIGLTKRATADWKMAVEVTDALREFDPSDPVKYDFALSRLGILKVCRKKREQSICSQCPLDPVCGL